MLKAFFLKPILVLPLFVLFSRAVEEYYPFSHYPMYATINTEPVWYIYLGDADNLDSEGFPSPLPLEYVAGVRPAKAKKIFQTDLKDQFKKPGKKAESYYHLPPEDWTAVADAFLVKLRQRSRDGKMLKKQAEKNVTVPENFALVFAEITIVPGEPPKETRRVLTVEKVPTAEGTTP